MQSFEVPQPMLSSDHKSTSSQVETVNRSQLDLIALRLPRSFIINRPDCMTSCKYLVDSDSVHGDDREQIVGYRY